MAAATLLPGTVNTAVSVSASSGTVQSVVDTANASTGAFTGSIAPSGSGGYLQVDFDASGRSTTDRIWGVTPTIYGNPISSATSEASVVRITAPDETGLDVDATFLHKWSVFYDFITMPAQHTRPSGEAWDVEALDNLGMTLALVAYDDPVDEWMRFEGLRIDYHYAAKPTAIVTVADDVLDPSEESLDVQLTGSVSTSESIATYEIYLASITAVEADVLGGSYIKKLSGAGGSSVEANDFLSGLPDGIYAVWARVSTEPNYGGTFWSDMDVLDVTIDSAKTRPAQATVTATADNTNGEIDLTINGHNNLLSRQNSTSAVAPYTLNHDWAAVSPGSVNLTIFDSTGFSDIHDRYWFEVERASSPGDIELVCNRHIPVTGSASYTALCAFLPEGSTSTQECQVGLRFYDEDDATISSVQYGDAVGGLDGGWNWAKQTVTSPASSVYARAYVKFSDCFAGEYHYFDAVGVYAGEDATGSNLFGADLSTFEDGLDWYDFAGLGGVERSTTYASSGTYSMRADASSGGVTIVNDETFSVSDGLLYEFSFYARAQAGSALTIVQFSWYDRDENLISTETLDTPFGVSISTSAFELFSVVRLPPSNATSVVIAFTAYYTSGGGYIYYDDLSFREFGAQFAIGGYVPQTNYLPTADAEARSGNNYSAPTSGQTAALSGTYEKFGDNSVALSQTSGTNSQMRLLIDEYLDIPAGVTQLHWAGYARCETRGDAQFSARFDWYRSNERTAGVTNDTTNWSGASSGAFAFGHGDVAIPQGRGISKVKVSYVARRSGGGDFTAANSDIVYFDALRVADTAYSYDPQVGFYIEASSDSGATWEALSNHTAAVSGNANPDSFMTTDYEAPYDTERVYRVAARVTDYLGNSIERTGAVSDPASCTWQGLILREADSPTNGERFAYGGAQKSEGLATEITPLKYVGRSLPAFEHGLQTDQSLAVQIQFADAAEEAAFRALVAARDTLCLRDVRGRRYYGIFTEVTFQDMTWGSVATGTFVRGERL